MSNVNVRVLAVVARKLRRRPEDVPTGASIVQDLGADSLDAVEIVMDLEDEFGLRISDEEAESIDTVQDACDYIRRAITERSLSGSMGGSLRVH